jgi:hypothetical protein
MTKMRYAVLALILSVGAAGTALAAGFAQGLSVGMKQGAIQEAQADMPPAGSREPPMVNPVSGPQDSMGAKLPAQNATGATTAASRMSEQGKLNTNGPGASDRDKGRARAEDRKSAHPGKQAHKSDEPKYKSSNLD